jgi:hypothetical protein
MKQLLDFPDSAPHDQALTPWKPILQIGASARLLAVAHRNTPSKAGAHHAQTTLETPHIATYHTTPIGFHETERLSQNQGLTHRSDFHE